MRWSSSPAMFVAGRIETTITEQIGEFYGEQRL